MSFFSCSKLADWMSYGGKHRFNLEARPEMLKNILKQDVDFTDENQNVTTRK